MVPFNKLCQSDWDPIRTSSEFRPKDLRKDLADRLAAVGDRNGAAGPVVDRHLGIDSQQMVNRGTDVADVCWLVFYECGLIVRRAVDRASLNSGASEAPNSNSSSGRGPLSY